MINELAAPGYCWLRVAPVNIGMCRVIWPSSSSAAAGNGWPLSAASAAVRFDPAPVVCYRITKGLI